MKNLIIAVVMILSLMTVSFAQVVDKADEIGVSVIGVNQDTKLTVSDITRIDANQSSLGFAVDYTHFIKNKSLGIQGEFALSFHNKPFHEIISIPNGTIERKGVSKVALGTGLYGVVLKKRNASVAPYIRGLIGVANTNLSKQVTFSPNGNVNTGGAWGFAYGGGGGLEFRLKPTSRLRLRTDATYLQTRLDGGVQNNFRVGVGLVY